MKSRITSTVQRTVRGALIAALAGAALSMTHAASAQASRETRTVINSSTAENTARVEVRNDSYKVLLNGKEVKSGNLSDAWTTFDLVNDDGESVGIITREGDEFSILLDDEFDGLDATTSAHHAALMAERAAQRGARAGALRAFAAPAAASAGAWGSTPRTMLGVTLDAPGEALSAQLGINRETTTVLSTVTDDLPAAKAGLKAYDVITDVNGEPAAPDTLRRFLREKNAGDTLALKVISGGARKDISVTLEAYDASRLNTFSGSWAPGVATTGNFTINAFDDRMEEKARELEDLGRQLAEKSAQMQSSKDVKSLEALGEQMNKIGEEMRKRGEEMARAGAGTWNIYPGGGQGGGRTIVGRPTGSGRDTIFTLPLPPTPPVGGVSGLDPNEAAALKRRMDQMDERLAKLIELMENSAKSPGTTASGTSAGGPAAKKDN